MEPTFIHINKCGGMSIKKALYGKSDRAHHTVKEVEPEGFSFASVRNPFTRLVSMYHYRMRTNQDGLRELGLSFKQWFFNVVVGRMKPFYNNPIMFAPCWDWISINGKIAVDFVGRLEQISDWWPHVQNITGAEELPHLNKGDYSAEQYNDEMKTFVKRKFKQDLKRWYPKYL